MKFLFTILFTASSTFLTTQQASSRAPLQLRSPATKSSTENSARSENNAERPRKSFNFAENITTDCINPSYDDGSKALLECESYLPPGVNISELITTPEPDGDYFRGYRKDSMNSNFRRLSKGKRSIRCMRRTSKLGADDNIPPDIMNPKLQHCLMRARKFIERFKKEGPCDKKQAFFDLKDKMDPETFDIMKECLGPLWERGKGTFNKCSGLFGRRKRDLKAMQRFQRYAQRPRNGCYYRFLDVFSGDIFNCIGGVVGMAGHVVDGCIDQIL